MYDVDEPISDYQKVVRERASQSLGPVRYALHSPIKSPGSKSIFHRGDNYNSPVTRLRTLLQRYDDAVKTGSPRNPAHSFVNPGIASNVPGSHIPSTSEVTQLLDNQFAVLQHLEGQVEFYKDALESLKQRTELVVRENETLFDQLKTQAVSQVLATEKQSKPEVPLDKNEEMSNDQTPRDSKEKDDSDTEGDDDDDNGRTVHHLEAHGTTPHEHWKGRERGQTVGENDSGEAAKSTRGFDRKKHQTERDPRKSLMPSVLHSSLVEDSFGMSARESQLFMSANERRFVNQLEEEVDKIRKLHEAKTKHLETLLYSTRDELEDSQRQVLELETKLRAYKVMEEQRNQPVLCVKCGHQAALLSGSHSDAAMETINKLTRERDDLMNTLTGQKAVLAEVRQREFEAYNQVKNSCHMVEQAQLEKAEAIIHVQQLKDDLQKERNRHDQYMKSTSEKMEKERENVRQACLVEANKLSKQLEQSIEARSALENQLERLTREKVDLATELEQAKSQIMTHASEIAQAGDNMQKELEQTRMKFSLASQEIISLKAAAQQAQREKEQERTRLKSEMDTLRRRLQEAEKGWMESKEDCIRFTERLNLADREAKSAMTAKEKLEKSGAEKVEKLTKQNMEREQQLTALLQETETRHTQCRTELQQMLEAEIKVCNKLKEECKKLTQQLQDSSEKARSRLQEANQECTEMKKKLQECMAQRGDLAAQNAKKDKLIKESDENARKQVDQSLIMAVSGTLLGVLVFSVVNLACICGLPLDRVRSKRELSDNDIIRGLRMYESQMSRMKRKIAQQQAIMTKQKKQMDNIKFYLKEKGDDYERDDLQAEIVFQTDKIKRELQLASLENLIRETTHHEKGQKSLKRAIEREKEVIAEVVRRVLDNRLVCRDTETDWGAKANEMIKGLTTHYVHCGPNELLQKFYLKRKSGSNKSQTRYKYRCCRLNMKDKWQRPSDL